MLATIQLTPYMQVQGIVARTLPNGQISIQQGGREYVGQPLRCASNDAATITQR
jgi:hypothetical protein